MSQNQKMIAGAAVLAVTSLLVLLYGQFSTKSTDVSDSAAVVEKSKTGVVVRDAQQVTEKQQDMRASAVPSTPDATVDAIINDASSDDQALKDEVNGEKAAVSANSEEINTLSQTYDENQLQ